VVGWRVDFSSGIDADFAGLLAVNQESCIKWMAEKAPPDVPSYCAVFPASPALSATAAGAFMRCTAIAPIPHFLKWNLPIRVANPRSLC